MENIQGVFLQIQFQSYFKKKSYFVHTENGYSEGIL
jgi:hypothetical protein